jgi:hypothetical protein
VPSQQPTVYLHIGPPKTGTTYIQDVLWRNRRQLAKHGVSLPGSRPSEHFHAALDLRGMAFGGHEDPAVKGSWARLAAKASGASSSKVVISHELFAGADDEEISTAVAALAPSPVHVVYGARDLARQLPAVWQESLKNRRSRRYASFLDTALGPDGNGSDAAFWQSQDPVETLCRWSRHVPAAQVHVITLPQAGAPTDLLWKRFCQALDIDPAGFDLDVARINSSLTVVEAEVLRRLNKALPADLDWPSYERIVKRRFNLLSEERTRGKKLKVPRRRRDAVLARAAEVTAALSAADYDIVGDLADLTPDKSSFGRMQKPPPGRVANAAVWLLAAELNDPERSGRGGLRPRFMGAPRRGRGNS